MSEPELFFVDVAEANAKFDREHGNVNPYSLVPIRSGFNESMLLRRAKLTDRKIAEYESKGFYSKGFKLARKELWAKKAAAKRKKRDGNFDVTEDGRLIYSPL